MKTLALPVVVVLFALVGCAQAQKPVAVTASVAPEAPVREVARALVAGGIPAAVVDENSGVVKSRWQDTRVVYGKLDGVAATIVRRYAVNVAVVDGVSELTVKLETLRCPRTGRSWRSLAKLSRCEPMTAVIAEHQRELEQLGNELGARITGAGSGSKRASAH